MSLSPKLEGLVEEAARAAARADIAAGGGVQHGVRVASLLAKAAKARQDGVRTLDGFLATLTVEEREWLGK